jgi:hypothetical protein
MQRKRRISGKFHLFAAGALAALLFSAAGCAYRLDYRLNAQRGPQELEAGGKTFTIQPGPEAADSRIRRRMLRILRASLIDAGWTEAEPAAYVFTVDYEEFYDDPWFETGLFISNRGWGAGLRIGRDSSARPEQVVIRVTARQPDSFRDYVWSADLDLGPVNENPAVLAGHVIPDAIERFPEQGEWEIRERVKLHDRDVYFGSGG